LIGAANNVRHMFWNNFIHGFGEVDTPFTPIRNKYTAKFQQPTIDYEQGRISADAYRHTIRDYADSYRKEVNAKLLEEFHIPTDGIKGWTVGTFKRIKEVGMNGKIHGAVGFATVAAVSLGSISLLRHNKHTLDAIENNLSALHDQPERER